MPTPPDPRPDLLPGPGPDPVRAYIPHAEFAPGDAPFLPEYPFDVGGPGHGRCFFMYGNVRFSPLYEGPSRDPWWIAALHRAVYGVGSYEKVRATEAPTTCHVDRWEVLARRCALPVVHGGPHVVFVDPRGYGGDLYGTNLIVATTDDLDAALAAAEAWAADLGIRFLVATYRQGADMH